MPNEYDSALARRMYLAANALDRVTGRHVTLRELGERIAAAMGRADEPYDPSVVRRWLKGRDPETRAQWRAVARVLRCDPGWLAFGEEERMAAPAAPEGLMDTARDRKITAAERARARRDAETERRGSTPKTGKRRASGLRRPPGEPG